MDRFILILLGIAALFVVVTYVLWRVSRRVRIVKYIPSILCLLLGLYYLYLAKTMRVNNGFEDLANFILSMMLLAGFASGLVTGLILDIVLPKFKR